MLRLKACSSLMNAEPTKHFPQDSTGRPNFMVFGWAHEAPSVNLACMSSTSDWLLRNNFSATLVFGTNLSLPVFVYCALCFSGIILSSRINKKKSWFILTLQLRPLVCTYAGPFATTFLPDKQFTVVANALIWACLLYELWNIINSAVRTGLTAEDTQDSSPFPFPVVTALLIMFHSTLFVAFFMRFYHVWFSYY